MAIMNNTLYVAIMLMSSFMYAAECAVDMYDEDAWKRIACYQIRPYTVGIDPKLIMAPNILIDFAALQVDHVQEVSQRITRSHAKIGMQARTCNEKISSGKKHARGHEEKLIFHNNYRILRLNSDLTRKTELQKARELGVNSKVFIAYYTHLLHGKKRLPAHFVVTAEDVKNWILTRAT